jgi:hypothetical protein
MLSLALEDGAGGARAETGWVGLPSGDVFDPLLADPKAPQSLASLLWGRARGEDTLVGAVAFGENIGLVRWPREPARDGVQLGVAGAVFAQFDMRGPSLPLINADYTVGVPLTIRSGWWSARARVHHQSSHLGDEYVLAERVERVNVSFEALELLAALHARGARVYAGGEWAFRASPEEVPTLAWHAGADLRHPRTFRLLPGSELQLVAGVDAKRSWMTRRSVDVSVRAGVELGPQARPDVRWRRRVALLAQLYEGYSPFGQFYSVRVRLVGVGVHFTL